MGVPPKGDSPRRGGESPSGGPGLVAGKQTAENADCTADEQEADRKQQQRRIHDLASYLRNLVPDSGSDGGQRRDKSSHRRRCITLHSFIIPLPKYMKCTIALVPEIPKDIKYTIKYPQDKEPSSESSRIDTPSGKDICPYPIPNSGNGTKHQRPPPKSRKIDTSKK